MNVTGRQAEVPTRWASISVPLIAGPTHQSNRGGRSVHAFPEILADFQLHMLCWSTSNIVAIFVAPIRIAIYAKTGGLSRSGASIVQSCSFPRTGWDAKRYQSMGRQDSTKLLSSTLFGYPRTGRTSSNAVRIVLTPLSYSPRAASILVVQVAIYIEYVLPSRSDGRSRRLTLFTGAVPSSP